jgi:hypothetical protein
MKGLIFLIGPNVFVRKKIQRQADLSPILESLPKKASVFVLFAPTLYSGFLRPLPESWD